jgi:DNA-directed RNA polymerase subunit H (RpoH/RPB5)
MDVRSIEYIIYKNLFTYLDIIDFHPVPDSAKDKDGNDPPIVKDKAEFIKTLQFYAYAKIKAKHEDGTSLYAFVIDDNAYVSKSNEFKKLLNIIREKEAMVIIVSREGLKTTVKKFLSRYDKKRLVVRDLTFNHFKVDPRNNTMVPRHALCSEEEEDQAMINNNITDKSQFSWIKHTDPQVLWLGGRPGQVVKIERPDTIGEVLYYRYIV